MKQLEEKIKSSKMADRNSELIISNDKNNYKYYIISE